MAHRGASSGFVLPAVLGAMLVITVISFAMSLVAALELLAARSAAQAVAAQAMADSALALALAEVRSELAPGATTSTTTSTLPEGGHYGPWPQHDVAGSATLQQLTKSGAGQGSVYSLMASAGSGSALAGASLVFTLEPQLLVLERTR